MKQQQQCALHVNLLLKTNVITEFRIPFVFLCTASHVQVCASVSVASHYDYEFRFVLLAMRLIISCRKQIY